MNGAEALVRRLEDHGVEVIYGLAGEENLAFVEALGISSIELITTRHEQHAAFMAATYGRLTGRPGVCLATLGPGALNLFTGLAHAQLGGMPLLAITGQKRLRDNNEGSFQIVDIVSASAPITTWSTTITDASTVSSTVDAAMVQATTGRPGATLIELPEDVAAAEVEESSLGEAPSTGTTIASPETLSAAADAINRAKRPVVLTGSGAQLVAASLTQFAERTGIGVLATQMGKGALPESHPMSYRSLGIHRPDYAHLAIEPADVVIAVGYQPQEHPPLAWNPRDDKTIIHVAEWAPRIEPGYQPSINVVGDVVESLEQLSRQLDSLDEAEVKAVRSTIVRLLEEEDVEHSDDPSPLDVVRSVRDTVGPEDIVALDNGAYKIWFARHFPTEAPNTLLLDNALATMGAGLATAMTAAQLNPDRKVIAVVGDGGFLMNVQDLETAVRMNLNLVILVLRDDGYGFIAWHQDEQGRPNEGVNLGNPDLETLASAFGANTHEVMHREELGPTLATALEEPGLSVIDCPIDYSANSLLGEDLYGRAEAAYAKTTGQALR